MTNSVDVTCRFNRIEINRFKLACHRKVYGKRYGVGTYAVKGKPQNFKKLGKNTYRTNRRSYSKGSSGLRFALDSVLTSCQVTVYVEIFEIVLSQRFVHR